MKIIESPRDGMQSLQKVIPTKDKVEYLNNILRVGFDTVEVGSIVSPKLIPQMADTLEVIRLLDFSTTKSGIMVLVANKKGAETISQFDEVTHISYPFSFSPTFLKMNLNSTLEKSMETVAEIVNICSKTKKHNVIYMSMAFGNRYGDDWSIDLLVHWVNKLHELGVTTIPLSNTAIEVTETVISETFSELIPQFPTIEFGLHLHTSGHDWFRKVDAAWINGCRSFDSVINGIGGCPMSGEDLLGNLKTEDLLYFAASNVIPLGIDREALKTAYRSASQIFVTS